MAGRCDRLGKTLNVVGAGRVGRVLARLFAGEGAFQILDVLNRSPGSAAAAVGFIGSGRAISEWQQMRRGDVTMLSVADDQILACCESLVGCGLLDADSVVFHCSGALPSGHLLPARQVGAAIAGVHPVRSFADPEQVALDFRGTFCGVEGDPAAMAVLLPALAAVGARCVGIDPAAKTLYHAASVFACNYLASLLDVALRAYGAAGIPDADARALAEPLVRQTVDNIFRLGPAGALTGPIARGDFGTVARQQAAVDAWDGQSGQLYRIMAETTGGLARRKHAAVADGRLETLAGEEGWQPHFPRTVVS